MISRFLHSVIAWSTMPFHLILIVFALLMQNFIIIIQEVQEGYIKLLIGQINSVYSTRKKVVNIWNNIPAPIAIKKCFYFQQEYEKVFDFWWLTFWNNFTLLFSLLVILFKIIIRLSLGYI